MKDADKREAMITWGKRRSSEVEPDSTQREPVDVRTPTQTATNKQRWCSAMQSSNRDEARRNQQVGLGNDERKSGSAWRASSHKTRRGNTQTMRESCNTIQNAGEGNIPHNNLDIMRPS